MSHILHWYGFIPSWTDGMWVIKFPMWEKYCCTRNMFVCFAFHYLFWCVDSILLWVQNNQWLGKAFIFFMNILYLILVRFLFMLLYVARCSSSGVASFLFTTLLYLLLLLKIMLSCFFVFPTKCCLANLTFFYQLWCPIQESISETTNCLVWTRNSNSSTSKYTNCVCCYFNTAVSCSKKSTVLVL